MVNVRSALFLVLLGSHKMPDASLFHAPVCMSPGIVLHHCVAYVCHQRLFDLHGSVTRHVVLDVPKDFVYFQSMVFS
jgi:hypothetical protein